MPVEKLPQQLLLNLSLTDHYSFANYHCGANQALLDSLHQPYEDVQYQFIYLWGGAGTGRSHLLQACCKQALDRKQTACYLPLQQNEVRKTPAILQAIEAVTLVCIDDIDQVVGDPIWEEALFDAYNRVLETPGARLIVAAQQAPSLLAFQLEDLKSRLQAGLSFYIKPLGDEAKVELLMERAKNRGFVLSQATAHYLVQHYSRNLADLSHSLDRLDQVSLQTQRKVTIPLIKEVL